MDRVTRLRQDPVASWEVVVIDKLDRFLIWILQEATPEVHLCINAVLQCSAFFMVQLLHYAR